MKSQHLFTKGLLITISIFLLTGTIIYENTHWKNIQWLEGTWVNKTKRGNIYESWSIKSPSIMEGMSYAVKQTDTMVFETILITEEEGSFYYIPTVYNQNDQKPVRFKMVDISESHMAFENADHDFPQKIEYTKVHSDSLVATISGDQGGEIKSINFYMSRSQ